MSTLPNVLGQRRQRDEAEEISPVAVILLDSAVLPSGTWYRSGDERHFIVSLRLPIPINRMYRISRKGDFYADQKAKEWKSDALLALRAAGLRNVPKTATMRVISTSYCDAARDLDAGSKLTLDAVYEAASRNDRECLEMVLRKVTAPKIEHRLVLEIIVT